MISALEPVEFTPRGRRAAEEHPGTLVKKQSNLPSDYALLDRMQNVNISRDENFNEFWFIRDVYESVPRFNQFLAPHTVSTEEELYVKGNTAIWSRGIANETNEKSSSEICYTCETPIKFAFFCTENFLNPDYQIKEESKKSGSQRTEDSMGVGLIDSTSLKVYCKNGENLVTAIEGPIKKVWITKYCLLVEKDHSSTIIDSHQVPMPRLFSIIHPLEDMYPVLVKINLSISYLTESEYKIIFSSEESDLILMFDSRIAKHFICKLRKATEEETTSVANLYDTANPSGNTFSSVGGLPGFSLHQSQHQAASNSFKVSNYFRQSVSGHHVSRTNQPSPNVSNYFNSSAHPQSAGNSYRSKFASSLSDLQMMQKSSISMQARKIGECEVSKPLVPDLIIEQIWSENQSSWNEFHEMASTGFLHTDLIDQKYLCFLLVKSCKLNLIKIEKTTASRNIPIFGATFSLPAKDAVVMNKMNMIAVLSPCGTLMLYTGPLVVGKVHVGGISSNLATPSTLNTSFGSSFPRRSSLLPSVSAPSVDSKFEDEIHMLSPVQPLQNSLNNPRLNNCFSIRDAAGSRLTLGFSTGKMYRFSLPVMSESVIVQKCLLTLRQIFPKDALKFMIKWYGQRNVPGSKDYSLRREWDLFKNLLFESIGRPPIKNHSTSKNSFANCSSVGGAKKRRKSDNEVGSNSDWEYLLEAENLVNKTEEPDEDETMEHYNSEALLFQNIPKILFAFHLMYEELKLDSCSETELKLLSEFLYQLALDFDLENYRMHYFQDNPELIYLKTKTSVDLNDSGKIQQKEIISADKEVLGIFKEILHIMDRNTKMRAYPFIPNVNDMSRNVIQIISFIFSKSANLEDCIKVVQFEEATSDMKVSKLKKKENKSHQLIDILLKMKITRQQIERLPFAIHLIISMMLEKARHTPPIGCSSEAYELLLRPELVAHASCRKETSPKSNIKPPRGIETALTPRIQTQPDVIAKSEKAIVEDDGMEHIDTKLLRLRFPDDLRINDVKRFLNSSKPVTIDIVQSPNVSDHEFIEEQEKQLFALCTRTMALSVGRGMFTFKSYFPILTELLPIPKLCLTGKEVGRGATIELQQIEVPHNMSHWPNFHNGVAAGLRIAADPKEIDPTWIIYNRPKEADIPPSYAGFLMALGLNNSLKTLSQTYVYDFLIKSEELLSVALLLGISATYRGTMDSRITRMLSIHIEALLPPTAIELDVSHNIQVAALMGIGLLYQNTGKRHIVEALSHEINRPAGPEMDNAVQRESYALAAGLALGMVCLEKGNKDIGLEDLQLPDTLHYYMVGGSKRQLTGAQKEKYKLPSFQIREGDQVNIDVTAPGSTLALGLMFFRSDNHAVADWMKPPETMYLLDFVRPDLLMLRVLARGLILWNSVEPTSEWINSQIPKTLLKIIKDRPDPEDDSLDLDHEAVAQSYCNIITGAALSIGLKFAGTENPVAYRSLKKIIHYFLNANGQYISEYAGKATIESCIILILLSLSLVFAGSGKLGILRIIRMTRARIGPSHSQVTYGSHMAIHMALGFLFLGAGRFTISRSPQAIAALICALFPKFPTHSNDNRYHLQAFRHLYVLAIEPRLFLPRDIDSGKLVLSKMSYAKIENENVSVVLTMGPRMLPELNTLKSVCVSDPSYWPVSFEREKNWDQLINLLNSNGCIDIKQRAGCLSHLEDPNSLKSLLSQTLTLEKYTSWKIEPKSLLSFSNDKFIVNLTNKILTPPKFHRVENLEKICESETEIRQMMLMVSYDCLTRDKMHALPIYVAVVSSLINLKNSGRFNNCSSIWQMKIIECLVHQIQTTITTDPANRSSSLMSTEILNALLLNFSQIMDHQKNEQKFLLKTFVFEKNLNFLQEFCVKSLNQLSDLIVYFNIPLSLFNETSNLENISFVQFMSEMKKRFVQHQQPVDHKFLLNLWHLLKGQ